MKPTREEYLKASRANDIPEGASGLWHITKMPIIRPFFIERTKARNSETLPPGIYTSLWRYTEATMHQHGELVMHDFPAELKKHLIFIMQARGEVLITGLGLGCVTRGVLLNPDVKKVLVIENSPDVLKMVCPHMPKDDRLEIIRADAREWCKKDQHTYDCIWHDLWTNVEAGEPHLAVWHSEMICNMADKVRHIQGAWEYPRFYRRLMKEDAKLI